MTRVRADDYEDKSRTILDTAASLFARTGYPNAKMQDIAKACGASKSMLYHYYPTKDDLLFAMLKEYLEQVIEAIREVREQSGDPEKRFQAFVQVYVQRSAHARRRHVVAMNDVKYLPKRRQAPLLELEGTVVQLACEFLKELNPGLEESLYKPYTMMLIGMLNWTETWFRPNGPMKAPELCDRMTRLFLFGFLAEKPL